MTSQNIQERARWGTQSADGQVLLSPSWEVFVFAVSLLSLLNLVLGWVILNPHILQVVLIMDTVLTVVFASDLLRRLVVADDQRAYFVHGYGWIDLISTFPLLRIFRLFRVVRVVRVMHRLGGPDKAFGAFFANRASGGLLTVLFIAILVFELGALFILAAEINARGASITNAQDAVWYVLVTMSTVGYGDEVPVTEAGRLIGAVVIVVGVGIFGTLTGFLANAFVAPSSGGAAGPDLAAPSLGAGGDADVRPAEDGSAA